MLTQVRGDLGSNRRVGPRIADLRKLATQVGLGSFMPDDRNSSFRRPLIVGAIEGNRADRVASHALLGLLPEPFLGLRSNLHGCNSIGAMMVWIESSQNQSAVAAARPCAPPALPSSTQSSTKNRSQPD